MGYGKKEFYEKYKTYLILHIDKFFDNFRYTIYDFCKAYKGNILVISHDKSFINDKIWDNLLNIEFYNFANDKKKINYLSCIENHLFYNTKFILNIVNTGKNKNNFILKFFDKRNEHDNKDIKFLQKNFKLEKINCDLKPGFSFIIRAKNESLNVLYCLKTLVPILQLYKDSEIIFVDNKSADNTFEIAKNILSEFNHTKSIKI